MVYNMPLAIRGTQSPSMTITRSHSNNNKNNNKKKKSSSSVTSSSSSSKTKTKTTKMTKNKNNVQKLVVSSTTTTTTIQEQIQNDTTFLLQCCFNQNWNLVYDCCQVLEQVGVYNYYIGRLRTSNSNSNNNSCDDGDDSIIIYPPILEDDTFYQACYQQLITCDIHGNTPLHAAVHYKPPSTIICSIVHVANLFVNNVDVVVPTEEQQSQQQQQPPYHLWVNERNATPLVIACKSGASLAVIQELLSPSSSSTTTTTPIWKNYNNHKQQQQGTGCGSSTSTATPGVVVPMTHITTHHGHSALSGIISRYEMHCKMPNYRSTVCIPLEDITIQDSIGTVGGLAAITTTTTNEIVNTHHHIHHHDNHKEEIGFLSFWKSLETILESTWLDVSPCTKRTYSLRNVLLSSSSSSSSNNNTTTTFTCCEDERKRKYPSMLHAAAYSAEVCPIKLTNLLIRLSMEEKKEKETSKTTTTTTTTTTLMEEQRDDSTTPTTITSELNNNDNKVVVLPFHLAITNDHVRSQSQIHPLVSYQRKYMIEQLLLLSERERDDDIDTNHESIAHQTVPGTNGQSPLIVAIGSGFTWHIPLLNGSSSTTSHSTLQSQPHQQQRRGSGSSSTSTGSSSNSSSSSSTSTVVADADFLLGKKNDKKEEQGPLQCIFRAAPEQLHVQDPVTGLYPFMLAACVFSSSSLEKSSSHSQLSTKIDDDVDVDDDDIYQLDTIFHLLRMNPQAAQSASSSSSS